MPLVDYKSSSDVDEMKLYQQRETRRLISVITMKSYSILIAEQSKKRRPIGVVENPRHKLIDVSDPDYHLRGCLFIGVDRRNFGTYAGFIVICIARAIIVLNLGNLP